MPVDRPDPADDPDEPGHGRPPDDPRAPDAAPPLPLDQPSRVAVHRANRAQVEQAYSAHEESAHDDTRGATGDANADRGSWAEALPSLRAAWDQHQDRYPERERATPRTHTDGSWSSGEARRLTPEQNAEATKACADIHDEGERVALPAIRQIEAADPNRRLAGLEHMLKGVDRLKEKIADAAPVHPRPDGDAGAGKFRMPCDSPSLQSRVVTLRGYSQMSNACREIGSTSSKLKNLWSNEQYKGINSQWRHPETGLRVEVQFHTPRAWRLRNSRIRHTNASAHPYLSTERNELEAYPASGKRTPRRSARYHRIQTSRRSDMTQTITYYAIIDEFSSRERPGGVLRRVVDGNGQVDEAFTADLPGNSRHFCTPPSAATPCSSSSRSPKTRLTRSSHGFGRRPNPAE